MGAAGPSSRAAGTSVPTDWLPALCVGADVPIRPLDHRRTEQVGRHQAEHVPLQELMSHPPITVDQPPWFCRGRRCSYHAGMSKFQHRQGPVSPGQEGPATQVLPAGRKCSGNKRASPVIGGPGGRRHGGPGGSAAGPIAAPPWDLFGSFLDKQKGTNAPSPGRNPNVHFKSSITLGDQRYFQNRHPR